MKFLVITTTSLVILCSLVCAGISEQRRGPNKQARLWTVNEMRVSPSEDLVDMDMLDQDYGKALGDQGSIFETADGGKSWQRLGKGLPGSHFVRICFIDKLVGWALSWKSRPASSSSVLNYDAFVVQTQDGGRSWTIQHTVNNGSLNEIVFSSTHEGWAVGRTIQRENATTTERILVLRTVDQGRHWQDLSREIGEGPGGGAAEDIISDGPSKAVILTDEGSLLSTTDGGQHWRSVIAGVTQGAHFVNLRLLKDEADRLFVLSSTNSRERIGARVARMEKNHKWAVTDLPDWYVSDLKILSPNEMFVCGLAGEKHDRRAVERGDGILAFSSDGGRNWTTLHRTRKSASINALAVLSTDKLIAVGDGGWVFTIEKGSNSL